MGALCHAAQTFRGTRREHLTSSWPARPSSPSSSPFWVGCGGGEAGLESCTRPGAIGERQHAALAATPHMDPGTAERPSEHTAAAMDSAGSPAMQRGADYWGRMAVRRKRSGAPAGSTSLLLGRRGRLRLLLRHFGLAAGAEGLSWNAARGPREISAQQHRAPAATPRMDPGTAESILERITAAAPGAGSPAVRRGADYLGRCAMRRRRSGAPAGSTSLLLGRRGRLRLLLRHFGLAAGTEGLSWNAARGPAR